MDLRPNAVTYRIVFFGFAQHQNSILYFKTTKISVFRKMSGYQISDKYGKLSWKATDAD